MRGKDMTKTAHPPIVRAALIRSAVPVSPGHDVTRATMRFFGVVLGMAAAGLWLVPGAFEDGSEMLVRLVISVLFMGIALGLWGAGRAGRYDEEFQLDFSNGRLSHLYRGPDGIARVAGHYCFDDLEDISLNQGVLQARLAGGQDILRVVVGHQIEAQIAEKFTSLRLARAV
ncbi:MAG: hypothetical protein CML69_11050 [Rhodobacteraceae bacterium]|nr:hypothetical protein [Paracoccaceae bacterium]